MVFVTHFFITNRNPVYYLNFADCVDQLECDFEQAIDEMTFEDDEVDDVDKLCRDMSHVSVVTVGDAGETVKDSTESSASFSGIANATRSIIEISKERENRS